MSYDLNTNAMLLKALRIEHLPADKQEEALDRAGGLVYQAVLTRALEEMDEPEDEVCRLKRFLGERSHII